MTALLIAAVLIAVAIVAVANRIIQESHRPQTVLVGGLIIAALGGIGFSVAQTLVERL